MPPWNGSVSWMWCTVCRAICTTGEEHWLVSRKQFAVRAPLLCREELQIGAASAVPLTSLFSKKNAFASRQSVLSSIA